MKRYHISKKQRTEILSVLKEKFNLSLEPEKLEALEEKDYVCYLFDELPLLCRTQNAEFLHLKWLLKNKDKIPLAKIVVDAGAVRPISKGADLMAPGIVRIDGSFRANDIAVVVEATQGIPIAVVRALFSSEEISKMKRGKVAINIHHVGDDFWNLRV